MINSISIREILWGQADENRISFDFAGLPKGIHFTIAYNEGSPYVNFHVTINNPKLKITILKITKEHLNKAMPGMFEAIFKTLWKRVDVNELTKTHKENISFLPFSELDTGEASNQFISALEEHFKDSYKIIEKENKLRINTDIENGMDEFVQSSFAIKLFSKMVPNLSGLTKNGDAAMAVLDGEPFGIIRVRDDWYMMEKKHDLRALLYSIMYNKKTADRIIFKTKRSVVKLKHGKCSEDIGIDNPIILTPIYKEINI